MTTINTNTKYNFTDAENDLFSWTHYDGANGDYLTHKPSGRQIYQMQWVDPKSGYVTGKIDDETCQAVKAFRAELRNLQDQKPPRVEADYDFDPEPRHGQNGYCRKCHSYCYGDCQANS